METRQAGTATGDEKHEAHSPEEPAQERNLSKNIFNIGFNIFQVALQAFDDEDKDRLEYLWGFAASEAEQDRGRVCVALNMEWPDIHAVLTGGGSEAQIAKIMGAIDALRKAESSKNVKPIDTPVTKRIIEALDYARDYNAMVTVQGPTGRGKTVVSEWWAKENNHGRTIYFRAPSNCSRRLFVTTLCQRLNIGVNGRKVSDLERKLLKALKRRNVLIIDEAGHLLPKFSAGSSAIELVRDIYDICGTAVALIFTDVYLDEMKSGRMADYFEQFMGRIDFSAQIPNEVLKGEVTAVVRSFRKDAPEKLISLALRLARERDGKLRTLFRDLRRAKTFALSNGRSLSYEDLKLASDWRKSGGIYDDEQ